MDLSKPAKTLTTQITAGTGEYTYKKDGSYWVLSVEEAARLQSFPPTYKFEGSKTSIRKQIGNSVAPLLAQAVAAKIQFD
jgi:DNA (cytosine-5)-methyltransferase 1